MKRKKILINLITCVFILMSCNNSKDFLLSNKEGNIWRVVQISKFRNDSSLLFFRFNRDNTYTELMINNEKELKSINSNPDIKDYHRWEIINDTLIKIAYIPYKILIMNSRECIFFNLKNQKDTLIIISTTPGTGFKS